MAVERFTLAFAGPIAHAGTPAITDRAGIQTLLKAAQEVAEDLGIKSRHLLVLSALSSFVREFTSDNRPIVFASNQALSRRCCAMPVPTLQRVLRQLVDLGLIRRNLSPNGKRYTHRDVEGRITEAYGIDLGPLIERAGEIHSLLRAHQAKNARIALLRDRLSLCRQMFEDGSQEQLLIKAALRRKQKRERELLALLQQLDPAAGQDAADTEVNQAELRSGASTAGTAAQDSGEPQQQSARRTDHLTSNERQIDTHYQSSNPRIFESEEQLEKSAADALEDDQDIATKIDPAEVGEICHEALQFTQERPRSWRDLVDLALLLAPMIGIADSLAKRAITTLGADGFALTILCLVQKFGHIRSPAAYLSRLLAPQGRSYSPSRFFRSLAASRRQSASAGHVAGGAR